MLPPVVLSRADICRTDANRIPSPVEEEMQILGDGGPHSAIDPVTVFLGDRLVRKNLCEPGHGIAVRNGGFPPLYLDPVDFAALYMQRMAEAQQQSGSPQNA